MTRETIALVSCVKKKKTVRCPAQDLYDSDLFRKMKCYAQQHSDRWFILSAKNGLLSPETEIEPYEQTLNKMRIRDRREWADRGPHSDARAWIVAFGSVLPLAGGETGTRNTWQSYYPTNRTKTCLQAWASDSV